VTDHVLDGDRLYAGITLLVLTAMLLSLLILH